MKTIKLYRTSDDRLYRPDDTLRQTRATLQKSRSAKIKLQSSGVELLEIPITFYKKNKQIIQEGGFKPLNVGG